MDVILAPTLCEYTVKNGDLFVLSWERVRRVSRGSISSELIMCGGGSCSILLLPLVARCIETIDACIWRIFVFTSVVVTVWGSVGMFVVYRSLLKIVFLALACGSMLYVCVRGVMDVGCYVCIVTRGAVCARVWELGVFRHADVVCLGLVCILWQFSMLHSA